MLSEEVELARAKAALTLAQDAVARAERDLQIAIRRLLREHEGSFAEICGTLVTLRCGAQVRATVVNGKIFLSGHALARALEIDRLLVDRKPWESFEGVRVRFLVRVGNGGKIPVPEAFFKLLLWTPQ